VDANIHTGEVGFWCAIVTITTAGFGALYPVITAGRLTVIFILFMGVVIIGDLTSIQTSLLGGGSSLDKEEQAQVPTITPTIKQDIIAIKNELVVCASF
jgi:voltage-gated potassium channel